jgi:TPR repeat protein
MAKKVRFPLKMADGAQVRTLEELREHFDPESVLAYYDNGKLNTWLNDRYEESTAAKLAELDPSDADFKKRLCETLGATYEAGAAESVDFEAVAARNRRLERLRAFTADDAILAAVDSVAFSQEDLADLLDDDISPIYLYGEMFRVPAGKGGVTYIGVNRPKLESGGSVLDFAVKGIVFKDVETGWDEASMNPIEAMLKLGEAYWTGDGVNKDKSEAVKWYRKAAEHGDVDAMCMLGEAYLDGDGVDEDKSETVKWFRKAAEHGNKDVMTSLGAAYWTGDGVDEDKSEAVKCFRKTAEHGIAAAMHNLGIAYQYGNGVDEDQSEADKWYCKAAELGYKSEP